MSRLILLQRHSLDPRAPAEASGSITVAAVSTVLDPLPSYAVVGGTVYFTGSVTADGSPVAGNLVHIYITIGTNNYYEIANGTTAADGTFDIPWAVPFYVDTNLLPCNTFDFFAVSNTVSSPQSMSIAYETRIRDLTYPTNPPAGISFYVSGYLEFYDSDGYWKGIGGATVTVTYNSTVFGSDVTDASGNFSVQGSIDTPGTYTLTASYAGEGI